MKLAFFATGLVASIVACPWFVVQDTSNASPAAKPGYRSPAGASNGVNLVVPPAQGQASAANLAPAYALPALPPSYTERTVYEYDFGNAGANQMPVAQQPGQWLDPNAMPDTKARQAYAQAYRAYQSAADDAARSKATAELKAGLEKQYDAFIEGQAKQITHLEERLQKLKEQLEKRRGAKERMVELKLQMVLSQAEGLGFPDNGSPNQAFIYREQLGRYPAPANLFIPNADAPFSSSPIAPAAPQDPIPPATAPAPTVPGVGVGDGGGVQNEID